MSAHTDSLFKPSPAFPTLKTLGRRLSAAWFATLDWLSIVSGEAAVRPGDLGERRILDALETSAGVWTWDCIESSATWSPRYFEMHGLDPAGEKPSLELWLKAIHPDDKDRAVHELQEAMQPGAADYHSHYRVGAEAGQQRWVEIFGRVERLAGGKPRRVSGIALDVTEQHRALDAEKSSNTELSRANDNLKKFSTIAAHDLQEPLRKIEQLGDLLCEEYKSGLDADGVFYLKTMRESAGRMRVLINALLDFSRAEDRALAMTTIDMASLMDRVLSDCGALIRSSIAQVDVGPLPTIKGDEALVQQVFINLISNALKYARSGIRTHVRVSADSGASGVVFRIDDNGMGVAPEHHETIFEPFTRLNAGERVKGAGIGLALCRTVCERHGWTLRVESALGEGASFLIGTQANAEGRRYDA